MSLSAGTASLRKADAAVVQIVDDSGPSVPRRPLAQVLIALLIGLVLSAAIFASGALVGTGLVSCEAPKEEQCSPTHSVAGLTFDHTYDPVYDDFYLDPNDGKVHKGGHGDVAEDACVREYYAALPPEADPEAVAEVTGGVVDRDCDSEDCEDADPDDPAEADPSRRALSSSSASAVATRFASVMAAKYRGAIASTSVAAHATRCMRLSSRDRIRNDACGGGCFGASRGRRSHRGNDMLFEHEQPVLAPFDLTVMRARNAGADAHQRGVLACGDGGTSNPYRNYCMVFFYLRPVSGWGFSAGQSFQKGQVMGHATAISSIYTCSAMQDHVHAELYKLDGSCTAATVGGNCRWLDFVWGSQTVGAHMLAVDPAHYFCDRAVAAAC